MLSVTGPSENQGFWDDSGRTDFLVNPDLSALEGLVPQRYWKVVGTDVVAFSVAEQNAQDAAEAACRTGRSRSSSPT